MPWIRLDVNLVYDKWLDGLPSAERMAWIYFLLHVKQQGSRGRVKVTEACLLARTWNMPEEAVESMLRSAATSKRIERYDNTWWVKNWKTYQEDHKGQSSDATGEKGEVPPLATKPTVGDDNNHDNNNDNNKDKGGKRKRFSPPSQAEAIEYFKHLRSTEQEARIFHDHFTARNWIPKNYKTQMTDWKASARNWVRRNLSEKSQGGGTTGRHNSSPDPAYRRRTTYTCPKCGQGHHVQDSCPSNGRVTEMVNDLTEKMQMPEAK